MILSMRALPLVAAGLALALAGCGSTEPTASAEEPTAPAAAGPVTVTDARGKTITLDQPASKIGATEWNVAEYAVSLGVQPVAVSDVKGFTTWNESVTLDDSVTDLGTRGEPSVDTVAALGLDVLFVTDELVGDAMSQIEKSTPVVVLPGGDAKDPVNAMWRNVDLVAEVTGTEAAATTLREQFDAKVAETKAKVEASGDTSPVAFSDGYAYNGAISIRPFMDGSLVGGVLSSVGLTSAWNDVPGLEPDAAYGLAQTDVEGLTKLPDNTRFWYYANNTDGGDIYTNELKDNKVWTSLPFVEAGTVHRFPDGIWMFGGPASMTALLDGVQTALG